MRILILSLFLSTSAFSMNFTRVPGSFEKVTSPKEHIQNDHPNISDLNTDSKRREPANVREVKKRVHVTELTDRFK